ncbi:unnamed protein product [Rhizophagus irregularis]|nr:unnamed protein product [Rhizophagus irregularis]
MDDIKNYLIDNFKIFIIEKTGKQGFVKAIWKDGPSKFNRDFGTNIRDLYKNVVLKIFYNSQNISDEFLNKVKSYLTTEDDFVTSNNYDYCYGMSQNPITKDYILVFHEKYLKNFRKDCVRIT